MDQRSTNARTNSSSRANGARPAGAGARVQSKHGKGNRTRRGSTKAVVLAGGRGTRLAPYTSVLPKPLMPVGERAILEHVVDQLEACGIVDITFCVGYLSHLIRAVFDTRENGHVSISYVHEQEELGTAGPLRLVPGLRDSFIVMNGDVLTNLDYRDLIEYHRKSENALTIATRDRSIKIDYGVLHLDGSRSRHRLVDYEEKPEIVSTVSMGIYVLEPWVLECVPAGERFDFPDLVEALLHEGHQVGAYRYAGLWFDIGRKEDYEQAISAWTQLEPELSQSRNGDVPDSARATTVEAGTDGNGLPAPAPGLGATVEWKKPRRRARGVMLDAFRETLSTVPAPVTIVTTIGNGRPHGTTVSAFSSLSADPPLVLVALDRSSDLLQLLQETGRFAVNLLAAGQEGMGRACARKGPEKFTAVPWHEDRGLPRIEGAAAWLACDIQELIPGGDHIIAVGLVTACETGEAEALIYHRRRFLQLA